PGRRGRLVALDDVSFSIAPGEILGVVGESGAGKSLTDAEIIGLLDPPGRIAGGEIRFDGARIDQLPYEAMRRLRGRRIGAIFQDPLTSLDPLYTVGQQLVETIPTHLPLGTRAALRRGGRGRAGARHPGGQTAARPVPAPVRGWVAPARRQRARARRRAAPDRRRR